MRVLIGFNLMALAVWALLVWVYDLGSSVIGQLGLIIGEALFFGVFTVGIYLIVGGM